MPKNLPEIIGKIKKKAAQTAENTLSGVKNNIAPEAKEKAKKLRDYVSENLLIFITALVCVIIVLLVAVIIAMQYGDVKSRSAKIKEISGQVTVTKDSKKYPGTKNAVIHSGDGVTVGDGKARVQIDPDKYVIVERDSQITLEYTNIQGQGAVAVNLIYGSAIVRVDNEIGKKDLFSLKTPNSSVEIKSGVIRAEFEYFDDYAGGVPAKETRYQNFAGFPLLQLYDWEGAKSGVPMLLGENKFSVLLTLPTSANFTEINKDTDLTSLPEATLGEIVRISNERGLAILPDTLLSAYKTVVQNNYPTASVPTLPSFDTEEIIITFATEATVSTAISEIDIQITEDSSVSQGDESETETETETEPVLTTATTLGEFTQYTGETWWTATRRSEAAPVLTE